MTISAPGRRAQPGQRVAGALSLGAGLVLLVLGDIHGGAALVGSFGAVARRRADEVAGYETEVTP